MATRKATTKKATTRRKKSIKLNMHKPGELPEVVSVEAGSTLGGIIQAYALDGYVVSVNGSSDEPKDSILTDGDTIRIGVKTKNN